jgi:carboxylesterase
MAIWLPPIALVGIGMLWLLLRPISTDTLVSRPKPAVSYQEAMARLQSLGEAETNAGPLLDVCRSKTLLHGQPTEHVLVLLHGYTNCPEQFARLGERFHALGHNVFIPCLPYHGYADRMTDDIAKLTAEDLVAYGDRAVDIARGLGAKVTVIGFSCGGTVAAWLAQNRADIAYAVPIAACLGISFVPAPLTRPLIRLLTTVPSLFIWWDPRTREQNPLSVYHAYPRYASHSLAEILWLGVAAEEQARRSRPATRNVLLITNACEPGVNNGAIDQLAAAWGRYDGVSVQCYAFGKEMCLPHDLMTPGTPGVPTEEVYERLVEQVQRLHEDQRTK